MEAAYTPALDTYLCSLVSGMKQADKDGWFLQDRVLDILRPLSFAYEHLNQIRSPSEQGLNTITSQEQIQVLLLLSAMVCF